LLYLTAHSDIDLKQL